MGLNDKLIKLLSEEPVRVWMYGLITPLVGVLVANGVITSNLIPYIMAVAAAVLGVGATEVSRGSVSPTASPPTESPPVD